MKKEEREQWKKACKVWLKNALEGYYPHITDELITQVAYTIGDNAGEYVLDVMMEVADEMVERRRKWLE